jgi:proteasome lid subunit RPN8/RPN11
MVACTEAEREKSMLQALVSSACRLLNDLSRRLLGERLPPAELLPAPAAKTYRRLERMLVTDQVCRTMFEEFGEHQRSNRGAEEIGWVLLGMREENQALVLATLPAGANRNAGVAHVRFNSNGQALGSRIVRQWAKGLNMVGVVHTHPGSLRHPSDGDYQGDSLWVGQLHGGDGVFGIGTADAKGVNGAVVAHQPERHRQILGELCFSWYALGREDRRYRKLPLEVTLGPDLAKPLHPVWDVIETHAEALDCLCRQQAGVTFTMVAGAEGPALTVQLPLADKDNFLHIVLEREEVRYLVHQHGVLSAVDPEEDHVDRAVYLILAELAALKKRELVRS